MKDRPGLLLLAEFAIIMISVLLALGLDGWRENRASQQVADSALLNFERELRANRSEIESALDHHTALLEAIRDGALGVNLNPGAIENSAWEVVQSTGSIANIDFRTVEIASRIYELQRRYQRIDESSANIIYQTNFQLIQSDLDDLNEELLQSALNNLVFRLVNAERALLEAYEMYPE